MQEERLPKRGKRVTLVGWTWEVTMQSVILGRYQWYMKGEGASIIELVSNFKK